jgi:ubiquinone/menaquinone biosynthesis C-methylase UbiE
VERSAGLGATAAAASGASLSEPVWRERAAFRDLRSVIDPADVEGNKNLYIDILHKLALQRNWTLGRDDVVLDFGCGVGRFTEWLEKRSRKVIGLDSMPAMIEAARDLHPRSRCEWMSYGGDRLPLKDCSVDRILSVFVLQHVLDDDSLSTLINEFSRLLRSSGTVALIEQVVPSTDNVVAGYIRQRTVEEYRQVFAASGFEVVRSLPIRASWRYAAAITRRRVPKMMLWATAAATLLRARSLSTTAPYADQLMIFRRALQPS